MAEIDVSGGEEIVLDKPERGAKDGYLTMFFQMNVQMGRLISDSNGISDPRIRMYTLKMISTITDDQIRKRAYDTFNARLQQIREEGGDVDIQNQKICDFCVGEMQGHITSWFDQFIGITHRLRLGVV